MTLCSIIEITKNRKEKYKQKKDKKYTQTKQNTNRQTSTTNRQTDKQTKPNKRQKDRKRYTVRDAAGNSDFFIFFLSALLQNCFLFLGPLEW